LPVQKRETRGDPEMNMCECNFSRKLERFNFTQPRKNKPKKKINLKLNKFNCEKEKETKKNSIAS